METIKYIIKGILIGIGKVIPGVSGSLIAYSLGLYEPCIEAISNLFKDFKRHVVFLGKVGIGILIAVILGSRVISFFLSRYYMPTMLLFLGLILGSLFPLPFEIKKKDYIVLALIIFISFLLMMQTGNLEYNFQGTLKDYVYLFFLGLLDAFTMIIPGISGTALFMLLGCYPFILSIFENLFSYFIKTPQIIFTFALGVISGVLGTSKMVNYCFEHKKHQMQVFIFGFSISSIAFLFIKTFYVRFTILEFFLGVVFLCLGYVISFNTRA